MFKSVLIANRGEIACRIIRTARAMGLRTVAVYSDADRRALHTEMADEAVALGGAHPEESYLRSEAVLAAAKGAGAECIHPGYGFLAENAMFAEACTMEGITFVGPPAAAIRAMGRKDEAKALMREAGVPVLPGYEGDIGNAEALLRAVREIGYPVMVKAVAGGGGTGMRRAESDKGLPDALDAARREAASAFGDARLIVEKCLDGPRHIEVQVFADSVGNCVHLNERDCSLQRRRQKIVEESPAPGMTAGLRERMAAAAISAAKAVGYTGAGTVEFLVEDKDLADDSRFYFLEMNTRLQVEHPVTEAVTGLDLVEWQFRVAAGEPLGFTQQNVALDGHAVETRVYCEDPARGFLPSSGKLFLVRWPEGEGIRVDAGVRSGDTVSPFYDPMLGKIIAHGSSRDEAMGRLRAALWRTAIAGPRCNLRFLHDLLGRSDVEGGKVDTGLVERGKAAEERAVDAAAVRAGITALLDARRARASARRASWSDEKYSPWDTGDGFALSPPSPAMFDIVVDAEPLRAGISYDGNGFAISLPELPESRKAEDVAAETVVAGDRVFILSGLGQTEVKIADVADAAQAGLTDGAVRAPMHGRIVALKVVTGETVAEGAPLAILEAMKMEHRLTAPYAGRVADLAVTEGQQVGEGDLIAMVEAEEEA